MLQYSNNPFKFRRITPTKDHYKSALDHNDPKVPSSHVRINENFPKYFLDTKAKHKSMSKRLQRSIIV